jgi:PKD repeat protein
VAEVEPAVVEAPAVTSKPVVAVEPIVTPVVEVKPPVEENKPPVVVEMPVIKKELIPPVAVITAKPEKGLSPLVVRFSAQKSSSKNGKIVAYHWDFGDGDTSTKINPENTYWSTTFGTARNFIVTLTITDAAGATSSATSIIAVTTP